jgi:TolB protein
MKLLHLLLLLKIPLVLFCESLEVALPTRISKTPIYLTKIYSDGASFEEQRQIIESDLNQNGFSYVLPTKKIEETIHWPDVRQGFDKNIWKKEQIPFVIALQVLDNRLQTVVFDIAKGTSKKYPEIAISDRKEIHRLTDHIQKDLFGVAGIASTHLLYSLRAKAGDHWNSEIWVCEADGSNHRKLIGDQGYCITPNFFPKSEEFYYVTFQEGQSKIYRSSLNQQKGENMIQLRGSQALPAINRRGDQIAFISDTAGRPDLFVQNLDAKGRPIGKPRQLFSSARATQASPTYSPDGKQIAFVSDKDGVPRVYVIDILDPKDARKATPRLITKANRENTSPSWSPDGKKIAYSAKVDGVRQIWMIDLESQTEMPITTGPLNKENPSWAPDSLHLIYNTESEEMCDLYRVHIWHKEPMRLSQGRFAAWSSR